MCQLVLGAEYVYLMLGLGPLLLIRYKYPINSSTHSSDSTQASWELDQDDNCYCVPIVSKVLYLLLCVHFFSGL